VETTNSEGVSMAQRGPAQPASRLHRVELFLDRPAVDGNEARLAALLEGLPGVRSVVVIGRDPRTVEACLRVDFDPRRTGAAVMTAVLAGAGFAVVAAAERPGSRP
jgi:hypothetical protein